MSSCTFHDPIWLTFLGVVLNVFGVGIALWLLYRITQRLNPLPTTTPILPPVPSALPPLLPDAQLLLARYAFVEEFTDVERQQVRYLLQRGYRPEFNY